jgi:YVTN family beta-propeller protein
MTGRKTSLKYYLLLASALGALNLPTSPPAHAAGKLVGLQPDGSILLPDGQVLRDAGRKISFPGRPGAIALRPGHSHRTAAIVNTVVPPGNVGEVVIVDLDSGTVLQELQPFTGAKGSVNGAIYSADGNRLFVSDFANSGSIDVYNVAYDGTATFSSSITLPDNANLPTVPAGLALSPDGTKLYVALNGLNTLGVISLQSMQLVSQIAVGNAPYAVLVHGNTAYVTNQGGLVPTTGQPVNQSAGTNILVNAATGAANTGSVSVVDLGSGRVTRTIEVGLDPTAMTLQGDTLFVVNSNSDSISAIDAASGSLLYTTSLFPGALYGSQPNDIAVLQDGRLAVSLGGNNAVAIYATPGGRAQPVLEGLIPTSWYPGYLAFDRRKNEIEVVDINGIGTPGPAITKGPDAATNKTGIAEISTYGAVSQIAVPNQSALRADTATVLADNSLLNPRTQAAQGPASPIPLTLGAPSPIKHVFYIIKENRTYDQIMGDDVRGNGDASFTQYGAQVTPNSHRIADDFVLLDNFYAPSLNSADGHQWVNQALSPDYLEKELNSNERSYPDAGGDALAYASSGFLWDNLVKHGGTLRVYGEYANEGNGPNNLYGDWTSWYNDSLILEGKRHGQLHVPLGSFPAISDVPTIENNISVNYPPFDTEIPDQYRVDIFLSEFKKYVANGNLPTLTYIWLCDDHTSGISTGFPTPAAQIADNDLALGRVVDAISHSPYWKDSVIFATEDDAQDGIDHVDGHRTEGFVVSPYVKRGAVDSTTYSQVNMVRTIEQILGLPPMNQHDLNAEPMRSLFTDRPDFTPYNFLPSNIPLNQLTEPAASGKTGSLTNSATALKTAWQELSNQMFKRPQKADSADPQLLNRAIWYGTTNFSRPYPGDHAVLTPDEVRRMEGSQEKNERG